MEHPSRQNTIKHVWELLHPRGEFDYDYLGACISIDQELKKLCKPEFLPVLLILHRAVLGEKAKETDDHTILCQRLSSEIDGICMRGKEGDKYSEHRKTGVVPAVNVGSETCMSLSNRLMTPPVKSTIGVLPVSFAFYNAAIPKEFLYNPQYARYRMFGANGIFQNLSSIHDYNFFIDYISSLYSPESAESAEHLDKKNELRRGIDFQLSDPRKVKYYMERFHVESHEDLVADYEREIPEGFFTDAHVKLIMYLHDGFRTGNLDLDVTWDKLCETEYVKSFKPL